MAVFPWLLKHVNMHTICGHVYMHKLELQIWLWSENGSRRDQIRVPLFTAAGHIYPVTHPDQCIYMKLLDSMITADLSSTLCGNHAFVLVRKLYIYGNDLILSIG